MKENNFKGSHRLDSKSLNSKVTVTLDEYKYMKHIFGIADERLNRREVLAVSTQLLKLRTNCENFENTSEN